MNLLLGEEQITKKTLLCFFRLAFAPSMFSNVHTSLNTILKLGAKAHSLNIYVTSFSICSFNAYKTCT